jgi:hypothetical protein
MVEVKVVAVQIQVPPTTRMNPPKMICVCVCERERERM